MVAQWHVLAAELLAMEQAPHAPTVPVEKQLERDRAGEQLQAQVSAALETTRDLGDDKVVQWSMALVRTTAKYLLTACDRLRRASLQTAFGVRTQTPAELPKHLNLVRTWDQAMRDLSSQHGVIHPLAELVSPLRLSDADLETMGVAHDSLLNGEDLLAL